MISVYCRRGQKTAIFYWAFLYSLVFGSLQIPNNFSTFFDWIGKWVHPEIDNPEYNAEDAKDIAKFDEVCKIGFDLWQVKSGTIFDNILITDDVDEAKKIGDETWGVTKDAEKKMKDEQDEAEKAKAEAEAKEAEPEEEEEDDDEDLDEIDDEKEEEVIIELSFF